MSGIPYLGSKISLISKSEIRYEGILVDVNPQESTITFEQVRFFGTEGRRPTDEIAPMDKVFDCVVFRSADIKDLQVYETAEEKKQPEFHDPAVVSFASNTGNGSSQSGFQYKSKPVSAADEEVKMPKINDYASAASSQKQQQTQQHQNQHQQQQTKSFSTRNRPSSYSNPNANSNNFVHRPASRVVVPTSEFDFSQANAKFSKEEIITPSGETEEHVAPSYNKSLSFFDDISCQANTESSRELFRNDRNLNMETFGQAAPPRKYGQRGGRGGGRGYHRGGGYNNRGGGYNNNGGSEYNNYYNKNNNNNNNSTTDN